jgi:hypothetical protein
MHKPYVENYDQETKEDRNVNPVFVVLMLIVLFLMGSGVAHWIEKIWN